MFTKKYSFLSKKNIIYKIYSMENKKKIIIFAVLLTMVIIATVCTWYFYKNPDKLKEISTFPFSVETHRETSKTIQEGQK